MTAITQKLLSINFAPGRSSDSVDMIVIHVTEGSAASVVEWFNDPKAQVSAHYMVKKDGGIIQFVEEGDTAWHAGRVSDPSAPLVLRRPGVNPNSYSIGIEHEGSGAGDLTAEQKKSSVWLLRDISRRRSIPLDRVHVVGHHEVFSKKSCPGKIDVDSLVKSAAAPSAPTRPPTPLVVWSNYFKDWLLVYRVVSNTEWYFVTYTSFVHSRQLDVHRALTPLDQMERA